MLATLGLERKEIVEEQIMSNQDIVSLGDKTVIVYWWIAYYSVETWSFFLEGKLQALLKSTLASPLINCMIILIFTLFTSDLGMLVFVKSNFEARLFFLTFHIEITSDLEKSYKNVKNNSFIFYMQVIQVFTFDHICFIILILSLFYIYAHKIFSLDCSSKVQT